MQIDTVQIPYKEDVHICHTNFAKKRGEIRIKQLVVEKDHYQGQNEA
jgi:hypothetical protein